MCVGYADQIMCARLRMVTVTVTVVVASPSHVGRVPSDVEYNVFELHMYASQWAAVSVGCPNVGQAFVACAVRLRRRIVYVPYEARARERRGF